MNDSVFCHPTMVHLQRGFKHETGSKSLRAIPSVDARSIRATTGHDRLRHPATVLLRVRQQKKKKKKENKATDKSK